MSDKTITSANSVLTITVPSLFPTPVTLHGYATDKAWAAEAIDMAEVMMGVDGILSAGFTPNPVKQTISLQADSNSRDVFTAIAQAMLTARETFRISMSLSLPATGEVFTLTRGILTNYKQIPDGQKVLQPIDAVITWERVNRSLL